MNESLVGMSASIPLALASAGLLSVKAGQSHLIFHPALNSTPSKSCGVEKSPQTKRIVQQMIGKSLNTICLFSALRRTT
jgi:hypothetical protein